MIMGRFDGVLLASDFDNTLLYTEDALRSGGPVPDLPERNRQALEYFIAEGGRFAVATGRALAAFIRYADMVPMNAPGVVCNGAAIYDFAKGEYLETAMLDAAARERGQAGLDGFTNDSCRQHEHITKAALTEMPSLLDVPLPLGKILFEAEHGLLEEVLAFLQAQGWAEDYELIFSVSHLLEMTTRGANKGGMVRRLAARLGIPMERVYCAGDEANDISMLTAAAEGFAPCNCSEAVRACGATIVGHAREGAVADIVERLGERYP